MTRKVVSSPLVMLAPHRFVAAADEPAYLTLGWMRERPRYATRGGEAGIWLVWPCEDCKPVEPPWGGLSGGWWHRCPNTPAMTRGRRDDRMTAIAASAWRAGDEGQTAFAQNPREDERGGEEQSSFAALTRDPREDKYGKTRQATFCGTPCENSCE